MSPALIGVATGLALLLLQPPRAVPWSHSAAGVSRHGVGPGRRLLSRTVLCLLAGVACALFVGGPLAPVAGLVGAGAARWFLCRSEPTDVRRDREQARRDLPHLVHLFGAALRAGSTPADAARTACHALPGSAAARLIVVTERLDVGVDPGRVWASLAADPELASLGRCLARAHDTGASVTDAVDRLADELEQERRGRVEDRARSVGVRAAVPLGLCLLPCFLLLGIVPLVAGLLAGVAP